MILQSLSSYSFKPTNLKQNQITSKTSFISFQNKNDDVQKETATNNLIKKSYQRGAFVGAVAVFLICVAEYITDYLLDKYHSKPNPLTDEISDLAKDVGKFEPIPFIRLFKR
ncbi:MAG: hypothetical protein PHC64_00480 [Candidatus Gastranaerophilales bacterium]|nr:hypothetical protein [Candidatus Gastranaerophilales bacterium]